MLTYLSYIFLCNNYRNSSQGSLLFFSSCKLNDRAAYEAMWTLGNSSNCNNVGKRRPEMVPRCGLGDDWVLPALKRCIDHASIERDLFLGGADEAFSALTMQFLTFRFVGELPNSIFEKRRGQNLHLFCANFSVIPMKLSMFFLDCFVLFFIQCVVYKRPGFWFRIMLYDNFNLNLLHR